MRRVFFLFGFALFLFASNLEAANGLTFIVNASTPVDEISADEVSAFFFKKKSEWPDHTRVRFVDQRDSSAAKKLFVRKFLGKTQRDIDLYWIGEKNFSGQSAPIQAPSDELVISLVASLPGSIGYVSSDTEIDSPRVKQITVQGSE